MRLLVAVVLVLLAAPVARADDPITADREVRPTLVENRVEHEAPAQPGLVLKEVRIPEQRNATGDAARDQDMPQRGSFWWMVGVIVIAGLILAVLLD